MITSEILSDKERKVLKEIAEKGKISVDRLVSEKLPRSTLMAILESLRSKGAVLISKVVKRTYKLTDEGLRYAYQKLPERRIVAYALERGGTLHVRDLESLGMSREEINIGLGWIKKKKWGIIREGKVIVEKEPPKGVDEKLLEKLKTRVIEEAELSKVEIEELKKLVGRGLVSLTETEEVYVEPTSTGIDILKRSVKAISEITPEILKSRVWERLPFKPYNITAEPPKVYPGKKHFYIEFLNKLRKILLSMGFVEMEGPYVELEFWNFDILFQPQDHPAREVHDTFWLKNPSVGDLPEEEIIKRVKNVHEHGGVCGSKGWRYKWSYEIARRLVLRTQTTAVSARFLTKFKNPPIKAFSISKVFRPDKVDAKHLPEFHQFEGIVMDEDLTFRDLLGIVKEFFNQLGIEKLRFKPGYFPFTEPSVEGYIYHPRIGWVECFGAGMFRPEVLEALNVKYPVAAWGMGVERIAMIYLEINDIRNLYSKDLSLLRSFRLSKV